MAETKRNWELITVIGPTASGKTRFAAHLADRLESQIISGDSRQVYRGMDIGTGKDIADYTVDGRQIPYHLIDICDAGEHYTIFRFQRDFHTVFEKIKPKNLDNFTGIPILCGGSGLYIESVLRGYRLLDVPANPELREKLKNKSIEELAAILRTYKTLHNTTEIDSPQRAIRAIEIEDYYLSQTPDRRDYQPVNSLIIGIDIERELRRERISRRLRARLDEGMTDEIRRLLDTGLTSDQLMYYGLEYKYVTMYVVGQISFDEMVSQLETAIHQFAKRQMTWFRGMERRGLKISWIDSEMPLENKIEEVEKRLKNG